MVTDKLMEAIDMLLKGCSNEEQKRGMESVKEMLMDFNEDKWLCTSSSDRNEFLMQYLPEQDKKEDPWYIEKWYDEDIECALEKAGVLVTQESVDLFKSKFSTVFEDKTDRNEKLVICANMLFYDCLKYFVNS